MIEVSGLTVTFGSGARAVHAVRGISFEVAEGESFGLVGESGSGKSTVLRAMAGLNRNWGGAMKVGGQKLGRNRAKAFHRSLQMVFQDPFGSLHPRHTVNDILGEPLIIHGIGDSETRIPKALEEVGLGPEYRFRYPHQLSGGQRQRIAIARALIINPPVLLLDEPTSALDVSVQAEILNLLRRLRREHKLTYILVSHDLSVVAYMCDRLAIMNAGRVVEDLSVERLRAHEPEHPYTKQLLRASLGYDRAAAENLEWFD
jgi:ABC-type dipeptide/oligopeptide/nickel transport system ATPase subunit